MRPRPSPLLAAVLFPLALAAPAAADTVVVQPGDSLQAAVAAASPGDVLLVQAGSYLDPVGLVVDKPLTILGAGSAVTLFQQDPAGTFDTVLPLHVHGLAAGETVRVVGLTLTSSEVVIFPASAVKVEQCAGAVVLADVRASAWMSSGSLFPKAAVVEVHDSAQVFLDGCVFEAAAFGLSSTAVEGGPGMIVQGSAVWINASTVSGGDGGGGFPFGEAEVGGVGLTAADATVRLARTTVRGGKGGLGFTLGGQPVEAGDGATALSATNSSIFVRGGAGSALAGGDGALGVTFGVPDVGAGASAALLDATSQLTATPDAVLAAGLDGDGAATAPILAGAGTLAPIDQRLATLAVAPAAAQIGGSTLAEVAAEPLGVAVIGFSVGQGPALALPAIQGPVVLDLAFLGTLPALALDADGEASLSTNLPPAPTLVGVTIVLQSLAVNPSGLLSVSPPAFQGFLP